MDTITYALCKKYVKDSMIGGGAVVGKNVTISSIAPIDGGNKITFSYTLDDGTARTSSLDVMDGVDGKNGIDGKNGVDGIDGKDGSNGRDGVDGKDGVGISKVEKIGTTGLVDSYRITFTDRTTFNYSVANGEKGEQGIQGIKGERGEQGSQGVQGIQGAKGEKGDDGYPFLIYKEYADISEFNASDFPEIGLMFMIKSDEATSYPVYRYTGEGSTPYSHITDLTAGQGIKGDKGDKGEQGEQGVAGVDGKDGITYVPTIGTVTSGDTANVSVVVNDETSTAEFSFTVPKGKQGDKGIDGTNGIDGKTYSPVIGTVSSGDTASANVTLDNNTLTATFDFVIPKGDKGDKGDTINISAGDGITISSANSVSLVTQDGSENVGGITSADYTKFTDAVTKSNKNETAISAINNTSTGAVATAKSYADSLNTAMDARVQVLENSISGGGGSIDIDSELSKTSENPVQNKVIYTALEEKALRSLYSDTTINVGRKAGTTVGEYSTAEGYKTTASAKYSHAEGNATTAQSSYSHAEGYNTTASGSCSHAEGNYTTASVSYSHAEGNATTASGVASHAEGDNTIASGKSSHAEGYISESTYDYAHAEGYGSKAYAKYSHVEGKFTTASGESSHAEGNNTIASNFASHVCGKNNVAMINGGTDANTTGTAFVVGNGTSVSVLSNAFSVQYDGTVKAKSTITASTTADYAEFFEWLDGNPDGEDRVGYFVTLDGDKIRIATDNDYILGIVSGEPFVLGNGDCDTWNGMFLRDEFRRTIYEPAPKIKEVLDKNGNPTGEYKEIEGEYEGTRPKLNPEYDHTKPYVSRFDRNEWSPIGMLGVLAVRHDGTARVNGYVTVNSDGIATACEKNNTNAYRVIKSNSESVVEVIFK